MYLTCPNCHTVYAARAAMLKEGQGEVRCGVCQSVFNALDYLSDELPAGRAPIRSSPGTARAGSAAAPARRGRSPARDFDGEALAEPSDAPARELGLWLIALVLLAGLAFQYVWFAPEDLARRFPMLGSSVEAFCLEAGCMLESRRAPERVRMLARDVRAHPRYEGALLVTATFSNSAPWPQPFPRVRLRLYDVNGQTIAERTFRPTEYLQRVLTSDATLASGRPLQIALEMLAPEEAAVSFEFDFL